MIIDFHIHSRYSRATSEKADIKHYSFWAKRKGIDVLGSGDFTHPLWRKELKEKLLYKGNGIYEYDGTDFILSVELNVVFSLDKKVRKVHIVALAEEMSNAESFSERVERYGKLEEDGRPTLEMRLAELDDIAKEEDIFLIAAHAWTPWFGIFGSRSGFDSVEEAFEGKPKRLIALETGLSSDPAMNWMVSRIDNYTLVSNSDAHSPEKIGREANKIESEREFREIIKAIITRKSFIKTYEFYPEEGKYHYDGHRKCGVCMHPKEALAYNNICPVCKKPLTIGVLHRVYELADREYGYKPENSVPFQYIVPLKTLIGKVLGKGEKSKVVEREYERLIHYFGSEIAVYEAKEEQIYLATDKRIAEGIMKVKRNEVRWKPGCDGVYGELILDERERKGKQKTLGEF